MMMVMMLTLIMPAEGWPGPSDDNVDEISVDENANNDNYDGYIQRAANFASSASCTCGTNTFTCNQVFSS